MKRLCPGSYQYAVIRMDPVAMVEHYNDLVVTAAAQRLQPKKYLVYLDLPMDLPLPESAWFRFQISPIGTTLRHEEPAQGITSDMVIPIYPNQHHPQGRTPLKPETPFPFHNCYHWIENMATVRIRRKDDLYDDGDAVKLGIRQHLAMGRMFSDDCDRIEAACEAMYTNDPMWRAMHTCESSDESDEEDRRDARDRSKGALRGPRAESSPDSRLSDGSGDELPRTAHLANHSHKVDSSVNDLLKMDVFNLSHDDDDQFLPLVDLWFDLAVHLSEDDIPSPLEFFEEQEAIKRIIRDARQRNPKTSFPPRNGSLDKNFGPVSDESDGDDDSIWEDDDDLSNHELALDDQEVDALSEDAYAAADGESDPPHALSMAGPFSAPSSRPTSPFSDVSHNSLPCHQRKRLRVNESGDSSRRFSFPSGGPPPSRLWHRCGIEKAFNHHARSVEGSQLAYGVVHRR